MKYVATIVAFITISFGLSWGAVYSYWFAALFFQSVAAVRICDQIGSVILMPVRLLFWLSSDAPGTSLLLTDPVRYATINAVLMGSLAYLALRRWMFKAGD